MCISLHIVFTLQTMMSYVRKVIRVYICVVYMCPHHTHELKSFRNSFYTHACFGMVRTNCLMIGLIIKRIVFIFIFLAKTIRKYKHM